MLRYKKSVKLRLLLVSRLRAFALPANQTSNAEVHADILLSTTIHADKSFLFQFFHSSKQIRQYKKS